jgi:hypothetical protein
VWAVTPHTLCLFDGAFDAQTLSERMVGAALDAGLDERETTPFNLRRAVDLQARPAGRFVSMGGEA